MTSTHKYPDLGKTSAMFTSLPTNEELPFLPPLPDTPQHAYKSYLSEAYLLKAKTPLTRKLWEERSNSPIENNGSMKRTDSSGSGSGTRKWDVEVDYPVLTTRQSVFGTPLPIGRIPSTDYLKTIKKTPVQTKPMAESASPDSSSQEISQPNPAEIPIPEDTSDVLTVDEIPLGQSRTSPSKAKDTMPLLSPVKTSEPNQAQQPRISASFNLPTHIAEASLLADQSLMGSASSCADEDSFHLGIDKLRPARASSEEKEEESRSNIPTKPQPTKSTFLAPPQNPLDQSTILPRSPAKTAHLLEPTNALSNIDPPWSDDSQSYESSISSRENSISPEKPSSPYMTLPHSRSMREFPSSSSSHSIVNTLPKIKRTFPASSSGQSLSSVCEDEYRFDGEVSTLLPVSPMKTAHLLTDAELISKEKLEEQDASFRLPLPTTRLGPTPHKPSFMSKTPRKSPPAKMSPIKTIVRGNIHSTKSAMEEGDVTFDVKDLLTRVNKPKRASGTEESFVDLLHDDFMPEGLDASMMGPDETMLPPSLRPRNVGANSVSPIKPSSYASPVRLARQTEISSPIRRFPSSRTAHNLAGQAEDTIADKKEATLTRSKSLSRVAEIIERVRSERAATLHAQVPKPTNNVPEEVEILASPPKTAIRTRTYTTARTPATTTTRPRTSMMPPPPGTSRRISLSAGALPLSSSASHKTVELPAARPAPRISTVTGKRLTTTTNRPVTSTTASSRLGITARPAVSSRTMLPPTSRVETKTITGSSSSTVSSSATIASIPTARATRPSTITAPSARPSITTRPTTITTASRVSRPSTIRPSGLPKPGEGPTARSAPSIESRSRVSRGFGTDATSSTNRSSAVSSRVLSELSTGPTTARSAEPIKSRALSTPASSTLPRTAEKVPPLPTSRVARPPTTAREGIKKGSLPAPSGGTAAQRSRIGSSTTSTTSTAGLPRPSVRPTAGIGKSSAPPTSAPGPGLNALRERLDRLHARQVR
ncbi:hypothetical protein I302_103368 [Kwoniella bestiolae CBS 10118]|uniref:Uncharacterized protein n=1 Tax=Kwoniella bestiolae CBS 10118 TaxID=1296100 RepID=A0A1B9G879_9TREE|nr:hypothetical protein I302_02069 [Kwoniella bestiolae CBS 10118]OCF27229.1 hypothetical protein I302_02069 [Kwoniella bestiolae CBS 10118]